MLVEFCLKQFVTPTPLWWFLLYFTGALIVVIWLLTLYLCYLVYKQKGSFWLVVVIFVACILLTHQYMPTFFAYHDLGRKVEVRCDRGTFSQEDLEQLRQADHLTIHPHAKEE